MVKNTTWLPFGCLSCYGLKLLYFPWTDIVHPTDLLEQSKVPKMEGSPDRSAAKSHVLAAKDSAINSAIPKPVELETEESSPALAMTETTPTAAAANSPAQSQDSIPSPAVSLTNV